MKTDPLEKANQYLYVVDYDIPREPQSKRRAFYRHLAKLKKKMSLFGRMSTMSVVISTDRKLAEGIYHLATQYGRANIYLAKKFDADDE